MSGNYSKEVATNPKTGEVLTNKLGMPIYNVKRKARSVAIMEGSPTVAASPQTNPCGELTIEVLTQVEKLSEAGESEFFRARDNCIQMYQMSNVVAYATGQPTTAAGQIAREKQKAVAHAEKGLTDRTVGFVNGGIMGIKAQVLGDTIQKGFESTRDVGIAAANTGNTMNVGDITVSSDQTSSADSNDGGAGGEFGQGGNGSGSSGNTQSGNDQTIINIGGTTNAGIATDDAMNQLGTEFSQQIEPNANGSISHRSKLTGSDTIRDLEGDKEVSDDDGLF